MLADITPVALIIIIILIVLVIAGLIADRFMAGKEDESSPNVRPRPRFVRTLVRATMRLRRNKRADPGDESEGK